MNYILIGLYFLGMNGTWWLFNNFIELNDTAPPFKLIFGFLWPIPLAVIGIINIVRGFGLFVHRESL